MGSSIVAGGTGILLNNRMTYWHLDPNHVDCLQPGKRVRHTMNPVMVFDGASRGTNSNGGSGGPGNLVLVCGTPGADTQVQTNMQVITHLIDFGMTVAEAVEAPRWRNSHSPTESNVPHVCDNLLHMESRFGADVRQGLESRGHQLNMMPDWGAQGSEMAQNPSTLSSGERKRPSGIGSRRYYGNGMKSSTRSTQNGVGTRKSAVHSLSGTPFASWL